MKYTAVIEINIEDLSKEAEEKMHKGWKLQGGISISADPFDKELIWYSQAMTHE